MALIFCLPQDVLYTIFSKLITRDVLNCQKVCRTWLVTARLQLLSEVRLKSLYAVRKFITCVDSNPDPVYVNAVKRITIDGLGYYGANFQHDDRNVICGLFIRFPNIREVQIHNSSDFLEVFSDDDVCRNVLASCPKLCSFIASGDASSMCKHTHVYSRVLYNFRSVVRKIDMRAIETEYNVEVGFGKVATFLSAFPNLQSIVSWRFPNRTFRSTLPAFEEISNITDYSLNTYEDDEKGFLETYLSTKTAYERDMVIERLSKIDTLSWGAFSFRNCCHNSWKFIGDYLTGLKRITVYPLWDTDPSEDQPFAQICDTLLKLISTTNECYVHTMTTITLLQEYLPAFVERVLNQRPSATSSHRRLQVVIKDGYYRQGMAGLKVKVNKHQCQRTLELYLAGKFTFGEFVKKVFQTGVILSKVDEFTLVFSNIQGIQRSNTSDNIEDYGELLQMMPSLRKLRLDVKAKSIVGSIGNVAKKLPLVEDLTIRANANADIQLLLDHCPCAFTNLKHLALQRFFGISNDGDDEYKIDLKTYILDKLTIDTITLLAKKQENARDIDFVLIHLYITEGNIRVLYKVSLDSIITTINHATLDTLKKRYYLFSQIHVTIRRLKQFSIYTLADTKRYSDYESHFEESVEPILLFDSKRLHILKPPHIFHQ